MISESTTRGDKRTVGVGFLGGVCSTGGSSYKTRGVSGGELGGGDIERDLDLDLLDTRGFRDDHVLVRRWFTFRAPSSSSSITRGVSGRDGDRTVRRSVITGERLSLDGDLDLVRDLRTLIPFEPFEPCRGRGVFRGEYGLDSISESNGIDNAILFVCLCLLPASASAPTPTIGVGPVSRLMGLFMSATNTLVRSDGTLCTTWDSGTSFLTTAGTAVTVVTVNEFDGAASAC